LEVALGVELKPENTTSLILRDAASWKLIGRFINKLLTIREEDEWIRQRQILIPIS